MSFSENNRTFQSYQEMLDNYTVDRLLKLARLVDTKIRGNKQHLIESIDRYIKGKGLIEIWEQLTELEKSAVAETIYSVHLCLDRDAFKAKYGCLPRLGISNHWDRDWDEDEDEDGDNDAKKKTSLLSLLLYQNGQVSRDIQMRLLEFVPKPKKSTVVTEKEPLQKGKIKEYQRHKRKKKDIEIIKEIDLSKRETAQEALNDIHTVLRLVEIGKVTVSDKTRRITSAGASAIEEFLYGGDFYSLDLSKSPNRSDNGYRTDSLSIGFIKPFAWPLILQASKLARAKGTKLELTPSGKNALSTSPQEVIHQCWNDWVASDLLDELVRIETIKGQTKSQRYLTNPAERRKQIAKCLRECPIGAWIKVDEFFRFLRASGHHFQIAKNGYASFYIADPQYGWLGNGSWEIIEGRYILAFLFEYAATMGIIDIAYILPHQARTDYHDLWGTDDLDFFSRYDGLQYIRINALGAYCLGQMSEFVLPEGAQDPILKVLPNFEIVAVAKDFSRADTIFLERFAEKTADFVWQLEPRKILNAIEQGCILSEFISFLKKKSAVPLPQTVETMFNDIQERTSRLYDRGLARLIESCDPSTLQLIRHDKELSHLCHIAGEKYIAIPLHNETAFRVTLKRLGYCLPLMQKSSEIK